MAALGIIMYFSEDNKIEFKIILMLFGFIFLDSDEDPLPPKIRYMHAISIPLCILLFLYI